MIFLQADLGLFFGRFHALVVHLPIGFLILGSIFFFLSKREKWQHFKRVLPVSFFLAMVGSILALIMGFLLAEEGGYPSQTLFWHRTLGIATALFSSFLFAHFSGFIQLKKELPSWVVLGILFVLLATGHFGGQLTHGPDYLVAYAPSTVKKVLASQKLEAKAATKYPLNPDSIFIYQHLVQPIFDEKCVNCHNAQFTKGGLALDSKEGLLKGGNQGDVLAIKPEQGSQLLHRLMLDPENRKFMPPKGTPLKYNEVKLLEYWINSGAPFKLTITDEAIPSVIKELLEKEYGLSDRRKSYVELNNVTPANANTLRNIQDLGFVVKPLSSESNFLELIYRDSLSVEKMEALLDIKEQISWLNLSRAIFSNDCLKHISSFNNLTQLQLAQTSISDEDLILFQDLEHLETLNLFGTSITDNGLKHLEALTRLQRLYLSGTQVSSEAKKALQSKLPETLIRIN